MTGLARAAELGDDALVPLTTRGQSDVEVEQAAFAAQQADVGTQEMKREAYG